MGVFNPDNLCISVYNPPIPQGIKLPAGTYQRGEIIGKNGTAYGKIDGTTITADKFDCILSENISSETEITTSAYKTGEFRKTALVTEDGFDVDTIVDYARNKGIFIE